jgi:mono/diheme cytochrome c family protein
VYPITLVCVLLLLAWTAHQGGSLTHGNNYLFEFLPAPLKRISFLGSAKAKEQLAPDSFYAKHIHPVLDANCVACHGDGKINGRLRLDTYALLMKGGDEGPAVIAGQPEKSPLLQRVTLPTDHKKFMPAEGKPALKPEQIAWLRAWVQQGASPTVSSLAGIVVREEFKEPPLQPVGNYANLLQAMHQLAVTEGVLLTPVSRNPSDGLIMNTVNVASKFGDAQLAKFDAYAPYIVEINLARTAVTDASFGTLSKFSHLRALHLEGTSITGTGLAKLAPLAQLTYLNLSETRVTQSALAPVSAMKNLHHLYIYNTPAQPIVSAATEQSTPRKTP